MSLLVVLVLVAVGCREMAAVSYLTELERYQKKFDEEWLPECMKATNAPEEFAKNKMYVGTNSSQELKCFVECIYEKEGILIEGAVVRGKAAEIATILQLPNITYILDVANKCDKEVPDSSEKCVTGVRLSTCFRKYGIF